jgi:Ubiquitin-2 like Rad60 SUMO-like
MSAATRFPALGNQLASRGFVAFGASPDLDTLLTKSHEATAIVMESDVASSPSLAADKAKSAAMEQLEGFYHPNDGRTMFIHRLESKFLAEGVAKIAGASQRASAQAFLQRLEALSKEMAGLGEKALGSMGSVGGFAGAGGLLAAQSAKGLEKDSGGGLDGSASISSLAVQLYDRSSSSSSSSGAGVAEHVDCTTVTVVAVKSGDRALRLYDSEKMRMVSPLEDLRDTGSKWVIVVFRGHLLEAALGSDVPAIPHKVDLSGSFSSSSASSSVGSKRHRWDGRSESRISFVFRLIAHKDGELNLKRVTAHLLNKKVSPALTSLTCKAAIDAFRKTHASVNNIGAGFECGAATLSPSLGEEKASALQKSPHTLNIWFQNDHGEKTLFKIKATTSFGELFTAYAEKHGVFPKYLAFRFPGHGLIGEDETAADIGLEDCDVILVEGMTVATPIYFKIRSPEGQDMAFKVHRSTKFFKIYEAYERKIGWPPGRLRLCYDGMTIHHDLTPGFLEMETGDVVDASLIQTGD